MVTPRPSLTNPHALRALRDRAWSEFVGHARVIGIAFLHGLALMGIVALALHKGWAVDVPDRIIAAIAAVETGTEWRGIGDVRGNFARGDIGEVGPWQLSPDVLRDLRAYDRRHRVHADPVLAESLTRAWLAHLYRTTGNWPDTVAAFHAGLAGRHRPHAREYSGRVLALASVL
jgi:hypothetical protein